LADVGREKRGKTQEISADFDRETEAFDFYRMVASEMMTVDEVREAILPTAMQRAYLLDNARPKEAQTLREIFRAREETWGHFLNFDADPEALKRFESKWEFHRQIGARRVDNHKRKK
jgi:hypothetical protein